ncbi:hypothetical protein BJV78DRAFT_1259235 [Lactifluus subvellereus]|nr:hypothetical protein BJV78DRAFT_1259235 [Lactifluus subvellereus]
MFKFSREKSYSIRAFVFMIPFTSVVLLFSIPVGCVGATLPLYSLSASLFFIKR